MNASVKQEHLAPWLRGFSEAGDGARTHDPQLGKLMLYQLSYARVAAILAPDEARGRRRSVAPRLGIVGGRWAQGKRDTLNCRRLRRETNDRHRTRARTHRQSPRRAREGDPGRGRER